MHSVRAYVEAGDGLMSYGPNQRRRFMSTCPSVVVNPLSVSAVQSMSAFAPKATEVLRCRELTGMCQYGRSACSIRACEATTVSATPFHQLGTRNQLSAVLRNMSSRSSEENTERIPS